MDLNNLHIFVCVVEQGSLTKAAEHLAMPKSKVSRRITQLEQQQATTLLIRSTRKLTLTEAGRDLFERSQVLINELNALQQCSSEQRHLATGTLRLQIPVDFFPAQFIDLCGEFLQQYPQVQLSIQHYSGSYPQHAETSDIAFVLHQGPMPDSEFNAKALMSLRQSLYGAGYKYKAEFLLEHELEQQPCLLATGETLWHFQHQGQLQSVRVTGRLQLPSQMMRIEACVAGQGIAKLTDTEVQDYVQRGVLRRLETPMSVEALTLSLLYRHQYLPRRARLFIDFFQSNIGRLSSRIWPER